MVIHSKESPPDQVPTLANRDNFPRETRVFTQISAESIVIIEFLLYFLFISLRDIIRIKIFKLRLIYFIEMSQLSGF